ncbi:MAG: OmpH family outer membrane protein [Flavobacterium sp.]|jgi:outer membrane protein
MKRALLILGIAFAMISCNKNEQKTENFKTAYIDTAELLKDYAKYKAEEEKFKVKSEEMGRPLESKFRAFENEVKNLQSSARVKGQAWAQQKDYELQQRQQQLGIEQNALLQQLQLEGAQLRDSIVKELRQYIKDYGKKEGYDYIYGTGDAATILYSKDSYNITKEVLEKLNKDYSSKAGTEPKKVEATEEEEKK